MPLGALIKIQSLLSKIWAYWNMLDSRTRMGQKFASVHFWEGAGGISFTGLSDQYS